MRRVLLLQALYYLITGLWPVLHIRSFLRVSGPKTDVWLVKTLGGLIAAVGFPLLVAAFRKRPPPEAAMLSAACSATLATSGVYYVSRGRIWKVYLGDSLVELLFLTYWLRHLASGFSPARLRDAGREQPVLAAPPGAGNGATPASAID